MAELAWRTMEDLDLHVIMASAVEEVVGQVLQGEVVKWVEMVADPIVLTEVHQIVVPTTHSQIAASWC